MIQQTQACDWLYVLDKLFAYLVIAAILAFAFWQFNKDTR